MRIRGAKVELEDAGLDTDNMATSTSKLKEQILALSGVNIMADDSTFKSTYDIVLELSKVWDTLADTDQAALSEMIAGKRGANVFAAAITNVNTLEAAYTSAQESAGSAMTEYERWSEGIEAATAKFQAQFDVFSQSFLGSKLVTGTINTGSGLLGWLTKCNEALGAFPTALTAIGALMGGGGMGMFNINSFGISQNWLTKQDRGLLNQLDAEMAGLDDVTAKNTLRNTRLLDADMQQLSASGKQAAMSLSGTGAGVGQIGIAAKASAIGVKLLNAALNAVIVFAVSWALQTLIKAINDYANRVQIAKDKTEELTNTWQDTVSELDGLRDELADVWSKIDALHDIQGSGTWNDSLQNELETLQLQNSALQTKIDLLEKQAAVENRAAIQAFNDEVKKTTGQMGFTPIDSSSDQYMFSAINNPDNYSINEEQYIEQATQKMNELADAKRKHGALTLEEYKTYEGISATLVDIGVRYAEWAEKARSLGLSDETIASYQAVADLINEITNPTKYEGAAPTRSDDYHNSAVKTISGLSADEIIADTGLTLEQSKAVAILRGEADAAGISFAAYIEKLRSADTAQEEATNSAANLGTAIKSIGDDADILRSAMTFISDGNDLRTWDGDKLDSLLDKFPDLRDELEAYNEGLITSNELQEAFQEALDGFDADNFMEALDDIVSTAGDYSEGSSQLEESIENLIYLCPEVADALYDENGQLRDGAYAAMGSRDALLKFISAMLEAQLVVAQADFSNAVAQFGALSTAAVTAQQKVNDLKAALGYISNVRSESTGKSSGGGGSSSAISKQYEQIADVTEYYIKMSELRQKRMSEESDSYKEESQRQILYYQQLSEATYQEIERLRAKGYNETNADYRKLMQDYQSYQNSIYDIAYKQWQQQKQAAIDAIEEQIDAENERWKARKKELDHEKDYYKALIDLEEKYLDTIGDIHEEIASLDKELASAMSYPIGSSLSLFTQEEHDSLVQQLRDIEDEATSLYDAYQQKLSSVTVDTTYELDGITDEFERQYEILLKQYEISKADLAVARARRELESVLNERNVAMLVNGVWTWVADPESVKNAVEAVYDAQQDAEDALTDLHNTQRTQALEEALSNIEMQSALEEAAHDAIIEGLEKQKEAIEEMEFVFEDFIETLMEGTEGLASAFDAMMAELNGTGGGGGGGGGDDKKTILAVSEGHALAAHVAAIMASGSKIDWDKNTKAYATGGVNDFTGLAHLDGTPSAPEVVFNNADAAKLYALVHSTPDLVSSLLSGISGNLAAIMSATPTNGGKSVSTDNSRTVYIGNLKIQGEDARDFISVFERVTPLVSL